MGILTFVTKLLLFLLPTIFNDQPSTTLTPSNDSNTAYAPLACVNGIEYPDRGQCECVTCWTGLACDVPIANCQLSAETNEGYVQTEYWTNVAQGLPITNIASNYRTEYQDPIAWHPGMKDPPDGIFGAFREQLLRVHEGIGNVRDVRNKSMVIGSGATQLINAAIHAYAKIRGQQLTVVASSPYYYLIPGCVRISAGANTFLSTDRIPAGTPPENLVEIVTSPRNPDGKLNATAHSNARYVIHDNVFYWPSFIPNAPTLPPLDVPVALFSLSKLTGFSGSRLGWALVKDRAVADAMTDYIYYSTHGITVDAQYRATLALRAVVADGGNVLNHVRNTLASRWNWIKNQFATQNPVRFVIDGADGFPVIWIRCLQFNGTDSCANLFGQIGIRVRAGGEFGGLGWIRMNMMVHNITWTQIQSRITTLLALPPNEMAMMVEIAKDSPVSYPTFSS